MTQTLTLNDDRESIADSPLTTSILPALLDLMLTTLNVCSLAWTAE